MLVNKLPNHDDIIGMFVRNDSTTSGRWFLFVPSAISGNFSVPWVNGLLAMLWLSLSAVCIVRLLRIKQPVFVLLTAAVTATFPVVGYTLCYMFTADAYLFALLLAAFGAYVTDRFRWGFLVGGVAIGLSMGAYQAYVFAAIGLMGIRLISWLVGGEAVSGKAILQKCLHDVGALALGAGVYLAGLRISLALRGVTMKTYMGLAEGATSVSPAAVLDRIPAAYADYFSLFTGDSALLPGRLQALAFLAVNLASVVLALVAARRMSKPARGLRIALAGLLLATLPLQLNGITLLSTAGVHLLMLYPVCFVFYLVAVLLDGLSAGRAAAPVPAPEKGKRLSGKLIILAEYAFIICVAAVSLRWAAATNRTYMALELKFDNMMSLATRMVDRVERLPEYVAGETPVWYTGTLSDANYGDVKSPAFAKASATDLTGREWNYTFFMNNLYFQAFVNTYIGVYFPEPEYPAVEAAMESDAYQAMPYYPAEGSVRYIDGIILINGGPNPQLPP